jgi:hypothetical protein
VLDDVRARVSDAGGAPFDALAGACRVDAIGTWKPFEDKLRAAARELGVCGPRVPVTASSVLLALGTAAAVVAAASLAASSHRGPTGGGGGRRVRSGPGLAVAGPADPGRVGPRRPLAGAQRPASRLGQRLASGGAPAERLRGGGVAGLNTAIARRMGTPLPDIGDQAWLLNAERTVIVQVGTQVTKLTASKSWPGSLPALVSVLAARLADAAAVRDAPR